MELEGLSEKIIELAEQIKSEKSVDKQLLLCRNMHKLIMAKREIEINRLKQ